MMYGKASFLLEVERPGRRLLLAEQLHLSTPGTRPGRPRSAPPAARRYQVGGGWRRNYSAGTVIVNPSASSAQTFNLGASYTTQPARPSVRHPPTHHRDDPHQLRHGSAAATASVGLLQGDREAQRRVPRRRRLSTADGAKVQQWSCTGGNNQRWKLVSMGDGYNELVAKHSGKCLDVAASSTADAANVQQWSCHGGNNQRWMLVAID